jgi:hypothetical protein
MRWQTQQHYMTVGADMMEGPVGNALQSSELVEVGGNDTHDRRGGVAATGYSGGDKAGLQHCILLCCHHGHCLCQDAGE